MNRTWPNQSSPTMPMKQPEILSTGSSGNVGSKGSLNHAFDLHRRQNWARDAGTQTIRTRFLNDIAMRLMFAH